MKREPPNSWAFSPMQRVAANLLYQVWKRMSPYCSRSQQPSFFQICWWEEVKCHWQIWFITAWSPAWVTEDQIRRITLLDLDHTLIFANTHCGDGGGKSQFAARFVGVLTLDRWAFLHRTSSLVCIIADSRCIPSASVCSCHSRHTISLDVHANAAAL